MPPKPLLSAMLVFLFTNLGCQPTPTQPTLPMETAMPSATWTASPMGTATPVPTDIPTVEASPEEIEITFVDNSGFLIAAGETKILIDAIFEGNPYGAIPPARILRQVTTGEPPFDGVDLLLITHDHNDHYSEKLVCEYLQNYPRVVLVSSQAVVEKIIAKDENIRERVFPIQLEPGESQKITAAEIPLEVLYISHGTPDLLNLGFIISLERAKLFHTGDLVAESVSVADLQAYQLPQQQIDVAFVPVYMFEEEAFRNHITEGIQAQRLIPMHFSYKEPPRGIEANFPEAVIIQKPLHSWTIP